MKKITVLNCNKFFGEFIKAVHVAAAEEGICLSKLYQAYDPVCQTIMAALVNDAISHGCNYSVMGTKPLWSICHTIRNQLDVRLQRMAHFGMIHVLAQGRKGGSVEHKPLKMTINPLVMKVLTEPEIRASERKVVVAMLVALGMGRYGYGDNKKRQGFESDCYYTEAEPAPLEMPFLTATEKLSEIMRQTCSIEAKKTEDREYWQAMERLFVKGSRDVWVMGQVKSGRGLGDPNWYSTQPTQMAATAKKERNELAKTFRQYGGAIAAIAWTVFTHYQVEKDAKGKMVFSSDMPHQQFCTDDKKPSQFVKNFNALLKDPHFKKRCTTEYLSFAEKLRPIFGDSFDVGPFDGDLPSSKIGYELGSSGATLEDMSPV